MLEPCVTGHQCSEGQTNARSLRTPRAFPCLLARKRRSVPARCQTCHSLLSRRTLTLSASKRAPSHSLRDTLHRKACFQSNGKGDATSILQLKQWALIGPSSPFCLLSGLPLPPSDQKRNLILHSRHSRRYCRCRARCMEPGRPAGPAIAVPFDCCGIHQVLSALRQSQTRFRGSKLEPGKVLQHRSPGGCKHGLGPLPTPDGFVEQILSLLS